MKYLIQLTSLMIFLHLVFYLSFIKIINFPSYLLYIILMVVMLLYYLLQNKKIIFSHLLLIWLVFYLVINTVYYILAGAGSDVFEFYRYALVDVFLLVSLSLLYNLDDENMIATRQSIVFALLIGVLLLLFDFTHPGVFPSNEHYVSGRALATFQNQNLAGALLILGFILTIDIIPKKFRLFYSIYIFIGILVTTSRSNIMIYSIILILLAIQNKISRLFSVVLFVLLIMIIMWLYYFGLEYLSNNFDIQFTNDVVDRLAFFVDPQSVSENHDTERENVLQAALIMFAEHPIFGNGMGATRLWHYRVGPHNTFAAQWAEFGLIGLLIIPSFLYSTTHDIIFGKKKEYRDMGILFIIYFILSSLFSHNMFEFTFNMAGGVILAILGYKNKIHLNIR